MKRRIGCALILSTAIALVRPGQAAAFSLSLFPQAQAVDTQTIPVPVVSTQTVAFPVVSDDSKDTLDASPSASIDISFLDSDVTSRVKTASESATVLPIAPDLVKGISTYFSAVHPGIDIRADIGSPIMALRDGIVVESAFQPGGYGRYVVVEHNIGEFSVRTLYAHMKEAKVEVGDKVKAKDIVGFVGLTGHTTGAHLHLETRVCSPETPYYICTAMDPIRFITKGVPQTLVAAANVKK